MKTSTNTLLVIFGILALGVMALFPMGIVAASVLTPRQPTTDPQATLQAMVTQTVMALTVTAPTQTPIITQVANTPVPSSTSFPTATPVSYCDWVTFIRDVTIPDGTTLTTGETFTKTWRLKNRGTCTWTPDYMLVLSSGSPMGGTTSVRLPAYVAPGQTVDVSVTLTAPATPGRYTSYWMLRNPSGTLFGYGDNSNKAFYVDISVVRPVSNPPHGEVRGTINYPSEFNPPMTLYFQKVGTNEVIQFSIPENNMNYTVLLSNGTYYAYAWAPGYNLEGAYVNPDGSLKQFTVYGGEITIGINITDWGIHHHTPGP